MTKHKYTTGNLIDVVEREIVQRGRVYARMVAKKAMKQSAMDYEIGAMERILEMLREKLNREQEARDDLRKEHTPSD